MADYYVTVMNSRQFRVARFTDRKEPDAVYYVSTNGTCSCPVGHDCKHVDLIVMLIDNDLLNKPGCFDDTENVYCTGAFGDGVL
jgi:hypothetical protein